MPDTLETGQSLQPGDRITSNNGNDSFVAQADGNLVIYREPGAVAIWWSNTAGRHLAHATLTDSGAFVAFQDDTTYYWATSTLNKITGPCKMVMHDDGNPNVFDNSPQLLWASMSSMAPPLVNGHYYLIRNLGSGTCLTLEDDPNHFPRSIRGYTVKRSDEQRWYLKLWVDNHNEEENVYILQNKASGYLLTQNMPGPTVKGLLFGWPESQRDIDYQLWTHNREKGFSYRLSHKRCLNSAWTLMMGAKMTSTAVKSRCGPDLNILTYRTSTIIQGWDRADTDNQRWTFQMADE